MKLYSKLGSVRLLDDGNFYTDSWLLVHEYAGEADITNYLDLVNLAEERVGRSLTDAELLNLEQG